MPEVYFTIELPGGREEVCYSPSSVIKEYFKPGEVYELHEFHRKASEGLNDASDRVLKKFGFACSSAAMQLEKLTTLVHQSEKGDVKIIKVE